MFLVKLRPLLVVLNLIDKCNLRTDSKERMRIILPELKDKPHGRETVNLVRKLPREGRWREERDRPCHLS